MGSSAIFGIKGERGNLCCMLPSFALFAITSHAQSESGEDKAFPIKEVSTVMTSCPPYGRPCDALLSRHMILIAIV
jgi:hypothetical protein